MARLNFWKVLLLICSIALLSAQTVDAKAKKEEQIPSKTGRVDPKGVGLSSAKNQELLSAAFEQMGNEEYDAALASLAELETQKKVNDYERAKILQVRAQIASDQEQFDQAITYLEQAVASDALPNLEHFQAMLILSQLYGQDENYAKAIEWFDRWAADANTVTGNQWAVQAQNYYYMDNYEKAIEYVDRSFATGETPQAAWGQMKAGSLYELERYDDAAAFAREQKMAHLDDSALRSQFLGLEVSAYLEEQNYEKALGVLEEAKANNWFDKPIHWKQLYQLYFEDEKPALAASTIEEGIAAGKLTADAKLYTELGDAYSLQDKNAQAVEAYTKAAGMSPDDGTPDMQMGQLYLDMEQPEKAKASLDTALRKGKLKLEGNAWYLLCIAENDLDRVSAAIAACRKATNFDESRSNAQNTLRLMGAK